MCECSFCGFCSIKYSSSEEFEHQKEGHAKMVYGHWTNLLRGIDKDGRIFIFASGEDDSDYYYPKFCPECGRDLNVSGNPNITKPDDLLWNTLLKHRGHDVSIVSYGDFDDPADVCLECDDCGEVILDAELYTICAREES